MKSKKKTLLWSFERKDSLGGKPGLSYLFGTMHVRDYKAFGFLEQVYEKIDDCEAFATEFNLEEMNRQASAEMLELPEGVTLESLFSPKKYQKINKILEKRTGLNLRFFQRSLPFMVSSLISEAVLSKDMPFSLDESLWRYAKDREKVLFGLETYQQQIDLLKEIPLDQQVRALSAIGKNFKKFKKQLLKMTEVYADADIHRLYKDARKNAQGLRKKMLYDRNVIMTERLLEITSQHRLCCAVGAGHLAGKKGILKLLKTAGCKVSPISLSS